MKNRFTLPPALAAALLALSWPAHDALPIPDPFADPATVTLESGRAYTGVLAGLTDGRVTVVVPDGSGEVEYSLPVERIAKVRFPEKERSELALVLYREKDYDNALPLLESIYRQRLPYLRLLTPEQEKPLVVLVRIHRETGATIDAVVAARRLGRELRDPVHREELAAIKLRGYLELELHERAGEDARAWCARQQRHPDSALGWEVLAEIALREERFDDALWIALQPVAFASAAPMEHLEPAYVAALRACRKLGDELQGLALYREMRERELSVPEECPQGVDAVAHFAALWEAENKATSASDDSGPLLDSRPPKADLNLPLRNVRRLLLALPVIE